MYKIVCKVRIIGLFFQSYFFCSIQQAIGRVAGWLTGWRKLGADNEDFISMLYGTFPLSESVVGVLSLEVLEQPCTSRTVGFRN